MEVISMLVRAVNSWVPLIAGLLNNDKRLMLGLGIFALIVIAAIISAIAGRFRSRHRQYVIKASGVIKKLATLNREKKFELLRKTNPYVFEEAILTALKSCGFKIRRNKRYSGDGGIDGMCFLKGKKFLVQSKRYSGHINAAHVREFNDLCRRKKAYGLFVHCGTTGKASKDIARSSDVIYIISGDRLIDLFNGQYRIHF